MTQTTSSKNKLKSAFSLFKWELKYCSGTLAVYAILAAVFIIVVLTLTLLTNILNTSSDYSDVVNVAGYAGDLLQDTGKANVPIVAFQFISSQTIYYLTIVFTIIYTIRVFSYLHNKRKADLYGSMPIGRISMYFTRCITALAFTLIPALFFLGIISIVSLCFGQPLINETSMIYLRLIMGSIACISAYGLLAICCGTTLNTVFMFIITCIAYPISTMFINSIIKSFFIGFYNDFLSNSFFKDALNPLAAYNGRNIVYWIVFSIICICVGALLIKRRKFEYAQSSFAIFLPCHIVKILISFLVGIFLGCLFGSLNVFGYGYLGFLFGFVLGSVPAFVISHLIFYKGFEKLIKSSIMLAGLIVVVSAFIAVCNFDPFGYNNFIPKVDDVKSAGYINLNSVYNKNNDRIDKLAKNAAGDFEDNESISEIIVGYNAYCNYVKTGSSDKFSSIWPNFILSAVDLANTDNMDYCFAYKLNNGKIVTRVYSAKIYDYYSNMDSLLYNITSSKTYIEKYSAIMNADAASLENFVIEPLYNSNYTESSFSIKKSKKEGTENADEDKEKIIEALRKDIEADLGKDLAESKELYSADIYSEDEYYNAKNTVVCLISVSIPKESLQNDLSFGLFYLTNQISYDNSENYFIPLSYKNTIRVLKEIGVLCEDNTANKSCPYKQDSNSDVLYESGVTSSKIYY